MAVIGQGSFVVAGAVLIEAALVLHPGIAILLTIFGLNLFGDGLRDLLDSKIRDLATERQRAA